MNYIFDTNILLGFMRNHTPVIEFRDTYRPFALGNTAILSIVSVGEIKSLTLRNNWGEQKWKQLYELMSLFVITDINATDLVVCMPKLILLVMENSKINLFLHLHEKWAKTIYG
jgi:predicted nucleic acid-binding protein